MKSNDHPNCAVPALGRTRRRRAALLATAVASASLMGNDPSIIVDAFHPPHGRHYHLHHHHHHQHLHSSPASLFLGGTSIVRISRRYRSGSRKVATTSSLYMTVTTAELIEYATARKYPSGTESTTTTGGAGSATIIRLDRPDELKPTRNNSSSSGSSSSSSNVNRRRRQREPRNIPVLDDDDDVVQPTDALNVDDDESQEMGSLRQGVIPLGYGIEPINKSRKNNKDNNKNKVDHTHDELEALGITVPFGLRQQLLTNARQAIHKRIWIVDNSGSMNIMDGHRISSSTVGHNGEDHDHQHQHDYYQYHDCTRWSEVQETVQCHAQLSAALGVPTDFHLLNPPSVHGGNGNGGPLGLLRGRQTFRVGYGTNRGAHHIAKDWKRAQNVLLRTEPNGKTPLADKIAEIRREIVALKPQLEAEHSKVCLVLATDGSNSNAQNVVVGNGGSNGSSKSDGGLLENVHHISEEDRQRDIITALRSLQGLPVVVIIRLCTDHQPLVDFYSTCLDMAQNGDDNYLCQDLLEVDIDVLDDHWAEAREVHRNNPWLNYALILHRMREMGQDHRLFDLLDERPLDRSEVRDFVSRTLFGTMSDHRWNVHDDTEWARFADEVGRWQERENQQWNPLTRSMATWIDTKALMDVPP